MITIKAPGDLSLLAGSIVRKIEFLTNPVILRIAIEGPDEMRYVLQVMPGYSIQTSPVSATINTALQLEFKEESP